MNDQLLLEQEVESKTTETWWADSGWGGIVPNVRLVETVLSSDLREAFLTRDEVLTREQNDAQNTEKGAIDFWELVVEKFNNKNWKPKSMILNSAWGGRFFLKEQKLCWAELTARKIDPISKAGRAKTLWMHLSNELGTVHQNWTQSGAGDTLHVHSEESGPMERDDVVLAGSDRLMFLRDRNPAVMYLWFQLLEFGLFQNASASLPPGIQADGDVPDFSDGSLGSTRSSAGSTKK